MRRRVSGLPALVLAAALLAGGCENLWEWTVDEDSYEAALEEGRQALRQLDYARAEEAFARAVQRRPGSGEARYYLAKSAVLRSGIDVVSLVRSITDEGHDGAVRVFESPPARADAVYRVNGVVLDALRPVRANEAVEGRFAASDVDLDLAIACTLRAILRLRDTNADGRIDGSDLPVAALSLVARGGFSLAGVANVPPDDLNAMLEEMAALVSEGGDALTDALERAGFDAEDLQGILGSLGDDISVYRVNTGAPGNPGLGDNDGDGVADEECLNGLDDDGDSRVDEDARVLGCP